MFAIEKPYFYASRQSPSRSGAEASPKQGKAAGVASAAQPSTSMLRARWRGAFESYFSVLPWTP